MSKTEAVAVMQPKALTFGAFHLTIDGLRVHGKAELSDFVKALNTAVVLEQSAPFWKADLFAYAEKRKDWEGLLDSIIDSEKFALSSVYEYRRVAKAIPPENRVDGVSFGHHQAVAALPVIDQQHLLKKAKSHHLSVSQLKHEARKLRTRKILKGQAAELAKLETEARDHAWEAAAACRAIMRDDGKQAIQQIKIARRALDACEEAIGKLRKAQGRK